MSTEYNTATEFLQEMAAAALSNVDETKGNIMQLFGSSTNLSANPVVFSHTVVPPTITAPPRITDLFAGVSTTAPEIVRLNADIEAWIEQYFPAINACLRTIPEDWLCAVLSGTRPFGIDSTIFDLVWQRARDRAFRQSQSDAASMVANYSSRGFCIPQGAMLALQMEMSEKVAIALSDANRDAAIKDAEIKVEILKFAEEQALRYKLGILSAMADVLKVFALVPNNDIERERIRAQAMSSYYSALSQYYNIEVAFEELRLKAAELEMNKDFKNEEVRLDVARIKASSNSGLSALGTAAAAFGDIAAGASVAASTLVAQIESV